MIASLAELTFRPQNPLLNQDYDFKIKATASGGAYVISEKKSLRVGCTSSMSILFPENFSSAEVVIGTDPIEIFKVKPLKIGRLWCHLIENIVVVDSITKNG